MIVSKFIKRFSTSSCDFDKSIDLDDFNDLMIETCVAKIVSTAVLMTCNIVEFNCSVMTFFCELSNELLSFDSIVKFRYFVFACLLINLFDDKRSDLNSNSFVCEFVFEESLIISFQKLDLLRFVLINDVLDFFEDLFSRVVFFCFTKKDRNILKEKLDRKFFSY